MRHSNIAHHMQFLRRGVRLMVAALLLSGLTAHAQNADIKLQDNAPDRYVVERGDSLWSIAAKFLKEPFRWPEIWRLNQEQIRNPNRIFPGDVIVLTRPADAQSQPQLSLLSAVRLSPKPVTETLAADAIPAIPPKSIEPFLTQPLVIEQGGLDKAPRIVATEENRVHLGAGGIAYATGVGANTGTIWQIFRPGNPLIDPETKATLGYEAKFLGTARVVRAGTPATLEIATAVQEISAGDRLIAAGSVSLKQYIPRAPSQAIRGQVIGLYDGISTSEAGKYSIVAVNRGKRNGVEEGHVLALARSGNVVSDPQSTNSRDNAPVFKLPDERYGLLFVFRVFDAVSYGLVMDTSRPVAPADIIQTP